MTGTDGVPHTPRGTPQRHDIGNMVNFGLSTTPGLAANVPLTRGPAGTQGDRLHLTWRPIPRGHGLGIGLSSGIRTSHGSYGLVEQADAQPYPRGIW